MAVVARKRAKSTTYYVAFFHAGKRIWERVGTDRREAERLEKRRLKEVEEGTYRHAASPSTRLGTFLRDWAAKRRNRNAKDDRVVVATYLAGREWLAALECSDVRPMHSIRLVEELKETVSAETGRKLSEKYVSNIYGVFRTACRDARIAELMPVDPCVLPRGMLRRKSKKNARRAYEAADISAMLTGKVEAEGRVFAALVLLTGMREGEACGRRWRDWDRQAQPLGALAITTQYGDQPLKTESDEGGEHARRAPVHPVLARILDWWWREGFEWTYARRPTVDDFIVPRTREGEPHTRSSAYKLWRRSCLQAGVANLSLHSTRHTFLTVARRGGARKDVIEQVTHNATGDMVDQYTHWDWAPLCEAVLCLAVTVDETVDALSNPAEENGGGAGNRRESHVTQHKSYSGVLHESTPSEEPPKPRIKTGADAHWAARQRLGYQGLRVESDGDSVPVGLFPGDTAAAFADRVRGVVAAMRETGS